MNTVETFGGIDIFIANASAMNLDNSSDAWNQSFQIDLMATYNGVEAVIPHLKSSKAGDNYLNLFNCCTTYTSWSKTLWCNESCYSELCKGTWHDLLPLMVYV